VVRLTSIEGSFCFSSCDNIIAFMCLNCSRMKTWKMKKMKLRRLIVICRLNAAQLEFILLLSAELINSFSLYLAILIGLLSIFIYLHDQSQVLVLI